MAGWEQVLAEVVRTRRSALVGYACLFATDRSEAEDLVQEAIVKVFSRTRSFADVHAAEAYVRSAVRTVFLDRARGRRLWSSRAHLFLAGDARSPEAGAVAGVDVAAALQALAPRERACVVLRYFDDLAVAQVAGELGISEGAVKRYLSDAVGKMRAVLGDDVDLADDGTHVAPVDVARASVVHGRTPPATGGVVPVRRSTR